MFPCRQRLAFACGATPRSTWQKFNVTINASYKQNKDTVGQTYGFSTGSASDKNLKWSDYTITVPASSLKYAKEHMSNGIATIAFTIRLVLDTDQFGKLSVTRMYRNTASAWFDKNEIGDGEQTRTVTRDALKDVVDKENIDKTNGRATYQLDINPHGMERAAQAVGDRQGRRRSEQEPRTRVRQERQSDDQYR